MNTRRPPRPAPRSAPKAAGDRDAPARALVFDSSYDQYRGVVAAGRCQRGLVEQIRAEVRGKLG